MHTVQDTNLKRTAPSMSGRGFVRLGVSGFLADEVLAAQAGKARRIRLRHLRPAGRFGKRGLC